MPPLPPTVDLPNPAGIRTHTVRRHRWVLLQATGHVFRLLCLLGAIGTVGGLLVCHSPALADRVTAALTQHLTAAPLARFARMEQAAQAGDHAAVIREARQFLDAIVRPHPADAFGDRYRRALLALMTSAEATKNQAVLLDAGAQAVAFDPNDSLILFKYGQALAAAGQDEQAVTMLEAAFRIRPTAPQIVHALEPLLANLPAARTAAVQQRHLEALALCMTFPSWMSGNLVATDGAQSKAFDLHLRIDRAVTLAGSLGFKPTGVYLVLPRVPQLELKVTSARLSGTDGVSLDLEPQPQGALIPSGDGFVRITPPDSAGFDDPTVIGFVFPGEAPENARIEVTIDCRPSPAVHAAMQTLGSWQPPAAKPPESR